MSLPAAPTPWPSRRLRCQLQSPPRHLGSSVQSSQRWPGTAERQLVEAAGHGAHGMLDMLLFQSAHQIVDM